MKSDWQARKLKDVILINPSYNLPKGSAAKKIAMEHVQPFTRDIHQYDFSEYKGGSRFKNGDVLLARITPCLENGKTAQVRCLDYNEIAFGSTEFIVMRGLEGVTNDDFVYYLAISPNFRQQAIKSMVGSSGRQRVQQDVIENYSLTLPPLETQRAIAATLSCLDDKIELNNKIKQNLEAQAQAIFKSWFVDFEPFQNGEFIDSELGPIPKGWRVGTLDSIGEIVGGATPSKANSDYFCAPGTGIAWITPKDLSINKNKFIYHGELDITKLGYSKSSTKIMPRGSVLFSSRAPIGYIAIANNEVCTNQGFKSIVPKNNISTEYIYMTIKNKTEEIQSLGSGSTFKEVSTSVMKAVKILIPPSKVIDRFSLICNCLFEQQINAEKQNQALADLRDALLPKLMNGEIEVPVTD